MIFDRWIDGGNALKCVVHLSGFVMLNEHTHFNVSEVSQLRVYAFKRE